MKTISLFALAGLLLLSNCGQDAASKRLADETEARVVASIKQVLVNTTDKATTESAHTWYQSEVPNIIKLDPNAAKVYEAHARILQEVAANQPKLTAAPILTPEQAQKVRTTYQKLVDESTSNVQELTNLANNKTTMSEAEQRQFVTGLAAKQTHQLELVQYYGKRTAAAIDQRTRAQKGREYNMRVWGHE